MILQTPELFGTHHLLVARPMLHIKIKESHDARLAANQNEYRALAHRTNALLKRDKGKYVSFAAAAESHLNANGLQHAYQALKNLCSKPASQLNAIHTSYGSSVSDMVGQKGR